MSHMELEVKVLNINKKEIEKKIFQAGGKYISSQNQFLCVYDLPYINQRFNTDLYEYNNEKLEIRKNIALNKIKNLFFEVDQLLDEKDIEFLNQKFKISNLSEIFNFAKEEIIRILNSEELKEFINKYKGTVKKWIRLRKTIDILEKGEKEKTTLTIKHVLKKDATNLQQMQETEIEVSSFEETNELLEKIGFSARSYQEKKREKYYLNNHEIDIDTWPKLNPYIEVEGKDEKDIEDILNILGYKFKDTISCTVDEIYKEKGLDINNMRELKF